MDDGITIPLSLSLVIESLLIKELAMTTQYIGFGHKAISVLLCKSMLRMEEIFFSTAFKPHNRIEK